ncbi:MAG: translocation/assembly module TamB domain-containing protein [Balneola sp.]
MEEVTPYNKYKALKIFLIVLTVFVAVQLLGRFLLTTNFVHSFVKQKIESIANEQLKGTLAIGELSGDLWEEIRLTQISVTETDTIFTADTLYASYNIWSFIRGPYFVKELRLSGVHSFIEEEEDTVFNVQQLVESQPETTDQEKTESLQFVLEQIHFKNINARIYSPSFLPDSVISIENLNAKASFKKTDTLQASLSSLSFLLDEGRLPDPIKVKASAGVLNQEITLQEMIIESGRSLLKASASANANDSTVTAEASTLPFSLADIQPYLEAELPDEELNLRLSISGTPERLRIELSMDHEFAPNLEMISEIGFEEQPVLYQFGIFGDGINVAGFTNDSLDAEIGEYRFTINGKLTPEFEKADIIWGFTFLDLRMQNYYLQRVIGGGTVKDDNLLGHFTIHPQFEEQVNAYPSIYGISSDLPSWKFNAAFKNLDVSYWTELSDFETNLSFGVILEGQGFELSEEPWQYSFTSSYEAFLNSIDPKDLTGISFSTFSTNTINGQKLEEYVFKGQIDVDDLTGEGYIIIDQSRLGFNFDVNDFITDPTYKYRIAAKGFNVAEFNQLSDFPTYLNMVIEGEGKGITPEELTLSSSIRVDSSIINGARFQKLDASATLSDGILVINEGLLNSDIIEGEFTGRKNVMDETDPENWLSVDMKVKNIQPLAPLADLGILNATGDITGRITQDTAGILRGNMTLNLQDIIVDSLLTASGISGKADVTMEELRSFNLNLEIESPVVSEVTFQDIRLISEGIANEDTLRSEFELEIVGSDRGRLIQNGLLNMDMSEELIDIRFDRFDFITTESELTMSRPFKVRMKGQSIGTDTLDLVSTTGAFLKFSVPYADTLEQYAWIDGQDFDFGIIQEVIFGERFIDGVLSGNLYFNKSEEQTSGDGSFNLTRLKYGDIEADSLDLSFDIYNERLKAEVSLSWDEQERVKGSLDVPFVLKDQSELTDEFYSQEVEGTLVINPSELTRFKALLDDFGINETDGIISFNGSISGTAGEPNFEGRFTLTQPVLSGINVDTVTASFNYDHTKVGLNIESEIIAAGQKAAQIQINYPLEYDFRAFQVVFPEGQEVIKVNVKTEDFNLAVFNDFLNDEYMNGLMGTLNADLNLEGASNELVPSGYLRLSGGKVSVPIANITLDGIKSNMEFTQQGLSVKELTAQSGRGSFNANGLVTLEGIIPQTVDLRAKAERFRLANTEDYNLVIDLDSKLTGSATTPKATGKIIVRNGYVFLQDFGENEIEEVQLEGEELSTFSPYDSLAIEMVVEIERDFYVRNRDYLDMEIELTGELDAQKETKGDLSLFGSLNGLGGYVRPLGKLFVMEEANFTFSGPVEDPDLNIKSRYTPPTRQKGEPVELYYIIQGTAQNPEFIFDSDPPMEQSDIVCYTLFNKPCYSLESWQSVFASGDGISAADVLTDVLLDEVEALATRELGVDVVQIDNSGASGATSIKTGWYLNQRTFFAIINEISGTTPRTLFVLEYILSEKWDLIMTQGEDSRRGIDFRFQHDY